MDTLVEGKKTTGLMFVRLQLHPIFQTYTNNEEKLNIKNVAYHAIKEAIATLICITKKKAYALNYC